MRADLQNSLAFEFSTAGRIIFGAGKLSELGKISQGLGKRAMVVAGIPGDRATGVVDQLKGVGVECVLFTITGEPTVEVVNRCRALAEEEKCDLFCGLGGGSAIDTAKAAAILLANGGVVEDYLEVIGKGKLFNNPSLPCIAIPTTAGTGAEVTRNAVISSPEHRLKVSLRSPLMLPRVALVDPELTFGLPEALTASTGLDALTQLIEPYVSIRWNPITDSLCQTGMRLSARSLRTVYRYGDVPSARQDLSLASLLSGLALANSSLGVVHGIASVLGGMYSGPHGAICARLLPYVMAINVKALNERSPGSEFLARYEAIAKAIANRDDAAVEDGVAWVEDLCSDFHIPPLSIYGLKQEDLPEVIARSQNASSTKGNPIQLTDNEMRLILEKAM
jgi:alcohol dehydrogenase class IV